MAAAMAVHGPACSRDGDAAVTIRFWAMGNEGQNVKKLLPEFERRNPGVEVELQVIPWTAAHEKLLTAYAGSSLPDVWQLGNTWVPEFELLD
ncbi:MAG: extracellular solute-binding protein, partial [Bacteroidetes bacterium]|nr:extracellular solute-binding protein [Bacteroidota bacterium]